MHCYHSADSSCNLAWQEFVIHLYKEYTDVYVPIKHLIGILSDVTTHVIPSNSVFRKCNGRKREVRRAGWAVEPSRERKREGGRNTGQGEGEGGQLLCCVLTAYVFDRRKSELTATPEIARDAPGTPRRE